MKSIKEFLTIKEFSDLAGIEIPTLRYWDQIGLFCPIKRDASNNYRYYSTHQIITVNFIKVLSILRVPLKTIAEVKDKRDPKSVMQLIETREKQLDAEMQRLRECYSIIHMRRESINRGFEVLDELGQKTIKVDTISIVNREESRLILGPSNNFQPGEGFYRPFTQFCKQAKDMRINLGFPIGAMHDSWSAFLEAPGEPQYFFSTDPTGNGKLQAGEYVTGYIYGYYGQFGDLPERMEKYIKKNDLKVTGPVYVLYLHDEVCVKEPDQYLAQVCVAVSR
ncbi:MerR family transcriptional regulator [Candidatus Saccharibacteria bacterium]|nr:MerR family transcriptional regulator [Candidatus Saccharibacteria bacterium]MCL1963199.1 MerR family transcriptional regulator [Candidatus Saccharibacteria bacterium]